METIILESKICPNCNEEKRLTEYYTKTQKDGSIYYWRVCKKCVVVRSHKWEKENPEAYAVSRNKKESQPARVKYRIEDGKRQREEGYQIKWRQEHPERCKELAKRHRQHDITEAEWRAELKVFDYKCAYCGISEEDAKNKYHQKLHKEHVDHNGYNDLRNAVPACQSCNSIKHQDNIDEWYNDTWYNKNKEFFTKERFNKIMWWITEGYKDYIEDKPPYRIIKEKNKNNNKFHFNLWSIDEMRNVIEILATENKKKDLDIHIKKLFPENIIRNHYRR